jgi:hypothetical protein
MRLEMSNNMKNAMENARAINPSTEEPLSSHRPVCRSNITQCKKDLTLTLKYNFMKGILESHMGIPDALMPLFEEPHGREGDESSWLVKLCSLHMGDPHYL